MKKTIVFLFLSFTLLCAQAGKVVTIGAGSGSVSQTSMGTLVAGDVLKIAPGAYTGATLMNLSGIVIDQTGVTFSGFLTVGNLTNVIISGGSYKGQGGFLIRGICTGTRWYNGTASGLTVAFIDASQGGLTVYNGNPATKLLLNCSIANITLTNSSLLFMGSFAMPGTFQNVCDSISAFNITINNSTTNGNEFLGNSVYRLDAHDWTVIGASPNGSTDVGIFQLYGNARIHSIYRNGGYGYIERIFNTGLDGVGESYLYNCIDLNSWQYGTVDTRVDPAAISGGTTPPYTTGGNIHILNNTAGNKTMTDAYTTSLAVIGDFTGYKCEVRNNLGFNNPPRVGSVPNSIITQNTISALPDTSNNMYFTSAQITGVLVDQINCLLLSGSAPVNKGYTEPVVNTDIDGITRPQGSAIDIGATELISATTPVVPVAPVKTCGKTITTVQTVTDANGNVLSTQTFVQTLP